ncbi:type 1 glutamine amidotransferase [Antarcticimicrobium luteum]|uniref:Type 1 glutamine amidotransferase n=1 Tax=Antarcticimicrobium luteum TaxID=2547397 RepID=A0A4R5VG27_9RHOB|nr:type 1 glutamine amidotransferase [Antarcticimicrobium luteum]TDK51379.1 type 1 glutamine amidotransferase [Antarcticimicrobium luteum]
MRICILETDRPNAALLPAHGTYAEMFERWLRPVLPEAAFTRVHVCGGAPLPEEVGRFDAYLVTGSRAGVYEDHAWIAPLIAFLQRLRAAKKPLAGVCFGHQIMAQAFGGAARKSDGGWVLGRLKQELTGEGEALFGEGPLWQLSIHQDQVVELPPTARRLVNDRLSPNGALLYTDFPAMSVQFHPEFGPAYLGDLIDLFAGGRLPGEQALTARAGLGGPLDGDRVARGVADVLRARVFRMA